jgi:hypothetical protein
MRCTNRKCETEWNTKAEKFKEEWGVETYYADEYCPDCETVGRVIDDNVDRDAWADAQYDTLYEKMMEERQIVRELRKTA